MIMRSTLPTNPTPIQAQQYSRTPAGDSVSDENVRIYLIISDCGSIFTAEACLTVSSTSGASWSILVFGFYESPRDRIDLWCNRPQTFSTPHLCTLPQTITDIVRIYAKAAASTTFTEQEHQHLNDLDARVSNALSTLNPPISLFVSSKTCDCDTTFGVITA